MNQALKSGVIVGAISVIISLLVYLIEPIIFVRWWYGLLVFLINIGLIIYFARAYRKNELDDFMTFKEAFIHSLLIFIVSGFIGAIFNMSLYLVIDPELPSMLSEASIQQTYEMMKGIGAPESAIDEAMDQIKEELPKNFTAGGIFKNYLLSIIIYLLLALLTAAVVKKKKPDFE